MGKKIDISTLTESEKKIVLARREYNRRYASTHKEQIKKYRNDYYLRQAEKAAAEKPN